MKVILDLCGGSGSWSKPYAEAGYDVRVVDLPEDVRLMRLPTEPVHGILAAPPCTFFCRMRMCRGEPTPEQFKEGLSIVDACLRLVAMCRPQWWALENPQGYLSRWIGQPVMKFEPWHFGDAWTKRTWLWGRFTPLMSSGSSMPVGPLIHRKKGKRGTAKDDSENSVTPPGFARAFFEASP